MKGNGSLPLPWSTVSQHSIAKVTTQLHCGLTLSGPSLSPSFSPSQPPTSLTHVTWKVCVPGAPEHAQGGERWLWSALCFIKATLRGGGGAHLPRLVRKGKKPG